MVQSLHQLEKKMFIMAVFSSHDLSNSHFSVMEFVEHKILCHKNNHEVWFNNELIHDKSSENETISAG